MFITFVICRRKTAPELCDRFSRINLLRSNEGEEVSLYRFIDLTIGKKIYFSLVRLRYLHNHTISTENETVFH